MLNKLLYNKLKTLDSSIGLATLHPEYYTTSEKYAMEVSRGATIDRLLSKGKPVKVKHNGKVETFIYVESHFTYDTHIYINPATNAFYNTLELVNNNYSLILQ